jgi:WD40 repeat protein
MALVCVAIIGCGPSTRGGGDDGNTSGAHLELAPMDLAVTVVDGAAVLEAYTATLVDRDGNRSDVTSSATFALGDAAFGVWNGAQLSVTGGGAGPTRVIAAVGDVSGDTGLVVNVKGHRNDGVVPANAADLFAAATETPARAPTIAYPAPAILVPPDLGAFDVHWQDTQNNLFEITMKSQYVDLRIYKQASGPAYTAYTPGEWYALASGHEDLALTVAGLDAAQPAQKGTSQPQQVLVTNEIVQGGVYYWSTTTQGIFRYDMSTPATPPSSYFPAGTAPSSCIGCHGLSRDGTKMAMTLDTANGRGTVVEVADRSVLVPYATNPQQWNFATFTPDDSKLVTVFTGNMTLRSTAGGGVLASIPNSPGLQGTHPELSPDGTQLANVETMGELWDGQALNGSVVTRTFDNATNTFGPIHTLVPNASGQSNYYPSWSPDGAWLLFTRTAGNSYNDASAEVWVVKSDGTQPPIQLAFADTSGANLTNSWARWAPFQQTYGPSNTPLYYITFSSKRQFGVRPLTPGALGPDVQIWMAPFFPDKAVLHQDPSGPAFRLPFQDFTTSNHIAQWTQAIVISKQDP